MTKAGTFLPGVAGVDVPVVQVTPKNASTGNGPIVGLTTNYSLNLVNFDWVTWHDYEWENWVEVDALIFAAIGFLNLRGIWRALTDYNAGDSVFDPAERGHSGVRRSVRVHLLLPERDVQSNPSCAVRALDQVEIRETKAHW